MSYVGVRLQNQGTGESWTGTLEGRRLVGDLDGLAVVDGRCFGLGWFAVHADSGWSLRYVSAESERDLVAALEAASREVGPVCWDIPMEAIRACPDEFRAFTETFERLVTEGMATR